MRKLRDVRTQEAIETVAEILHGHCFHADFRTPAMSASHNRPLPPAKETLMPAPLALSAPRAIAMWDFSWLERRWPGAGYEDWGLALDGLQERGYDAVRIDAYPHLVHAGAEREWELLPEWSTNDWGAPARTRIRVIPALLEFLEKCRARGIAVGLSTWFRQDLDNRRLAIPSPEAHAGIWISTLERIRAAGLLDAIYYADLCNEWPIDVWAPFFRAPAGAVREWGAPCSLAWIEAACGAVRAEFPGLPLTFSLTTDATGAHAATRPRGVDFLEPHIWMVTSGDFYQRINYNFERFDLAGYDRLALHGEALYRADPVHWQKALTGAIALNAEWSRATGLPLVTTECWGVVDFKDWPLLDWGWVKELCALGTETAAATGRWAAIATSNFCGPQFRGMWRDVAWHRRLTDLIKKPTT
jgi:hypothetical protein